MQTRLTTTGRNNFNILDDINIEPAIIIRKNALLPNQTDVH